MHCADELKMGLLQLEHNKFGEKARRHVCDAKRFDCAVTKSRCVNVKSERRCAGLGK